MKTFELGTLATKAEIHAGLVRLQNEITTYLEGLAPDEFLAPQGEAWSPERHLRHLTKSVGAVAAGMRAPKILLRLKFGRPRKPSRSFEEVVEMYTAELASGARATGRYVPSDRPEEISAEEWCDGVFSRWQRASDALSGAIGRWSEAALERYQVPHPLLGAMTVREILFFTLYHNAHHARRIAERRALRKSASGVIRWKPGRALGTRRSLPSPGRRPG